jgi:hypothetical protein
VGQTCEEGDTFQALGIHARILARSIRNVDPPPLDSAAEACRSGRTGPPRKRLGA